MPKKVILHEGPNKKKSENSKFWISESSAYSGRFWRSWQHNLIISCVKLNNLYFYSNLYFVFFFSLLLCQFLRMKCEVCLNITKNFNEKPENVLEPPDMVTKHPICWQHLICWHVFGVLKKQHMWRRTVLRQEWRRGRLVDIYEKSTK